MPSFQLSLTFSSSPYIRERNNFYLDRKICSQRGNLKSLVEHVFEKYKQEKNPNPALQLITVKMVLEEKLLIF